MRKLTLANQATFFNKTFIGERFEYAFSTFTFHCASFAAEKAGWRIRYLGGERCEVYAKID